MKSKGKKGILILFGFISAFFIGEVLFRWFGPHPSTVPIRYDDEVGIVNQPFYSGVYNREGFSHYSINSEGWRDIERQVPKPKDVFRIALVGDSYVEALQVETDKMVASQLQKLLDEKFPSRKFEVLSFGMSGFDAAQAFLAIRHKVAKYSPDLVIWAFLPANDVQDAVRELVNLPYKPYFVFTNGKLELDTSFRKYVKQKEGSLGRSFILWLRANSRLCEHLLYNTILYRRLADLSRHLQPAQEGQKRPSLPVSSQGTVAKEHAAQKQSPLKGTPNLPLGLSKSIFRPPEVGTLFESAWLITEKLIGEMHTFCKEIGAKFMFFSIPVSHQCEYRFYVELSPPDDLFYAEKRMEAFSREIEVPFLPLAFEFKRVSQEKEILFYGSEKAPGGHWNEFGHQYAAKTLCDFFIQKSLLVKETEEQSPLVK